MDIIDHIMRHQERLGESQNSQDFPPHEPELLLIGCVDARKDPIGDLGIPRGKALILRNIAALIRGASVRVPEQRETEAAALEFAVNIMKVRHIAVMGHTDCGGIRAALAEIESPSIRRYLAPLDDAKARILAQGGTPRQQADALEREAVRLSVQNLRSYPYIAEAETQGRLTLHGWMLDIVTGRLEKIV